MAARAKKISELTAANTAANTDYLLIVTNTAGTAVTSKMVFQNVVDSVFSLGSNTTLNLVSANVGGAYVFRGSANTRAAVNTQVGTTGSNGSIYLSTAGKIYLKVAATGVAATDWQRVTTTAVD